MLQNKEIYKFSQSWLTIGLPENKKYLVEIRYEIKKNMYWYGISLRTGETNELDCRCKETKARVDRGWCMSVWEDSMRKG